MEDKKKLSDIEDVNDEFNKLNKRIKVVNDRFQALALDYKFYINSSWGQELIYELRDSTKYRLFSSKFHIEILLRQHQQIAYDLENRYKTQPEYFSRRYITGNPLYEFYGDQISSIFDSIIFHSVSLFDYLATLSNYICGNDKQAKFKWTQLAKSVRDPLNNFSKTEIANVVTQVDRDFVGKLYNHRSHLIHYKSDPNKYSISINLSKDGIDFIPRFIIGNDLTKEFSELRNLSKTNQITVKYASFWLLNQAIDKVNEILFALKSEMETHPKLKAPNFGLFDEETKTFKPASIPYWKLDEK